MQPLTCTCTFTHVLPDIVQIVVFDVHMLVCTCIPVHVCTADVTFNL